MDRAHGLERANRHISAHHGHPVSEDARARQRLRRARRAARDLSLTEAQVRAIADRHTGIGCDQLIVIEPPTQRAAPRLHAHSSTPTAARPGPAATRPAASRGCCSTRPAATERASRPSPACSTPSVQPDGPHRGRYGTGPRWTGATSRWRASMRHVALRSGAARPLAGPVCINMGNPHAIFFVADADAVDAGRARPASRTRTRCFPSAPISASPGARPRRDPAARLGARRRHHPRLRQRRLRRAGRGDRGAA